MRALIAGRKTTSAARNLMSILAVALLSSILMVARVALLLGTSSFGKGSSLGQFFEF